MTKNTKIIIALATLAGLFVAYKKGVFGGSSEDTTDNTPAEPKTTAKEAAKNANTGASNAIMKTTVSERPVAPAPKQDSVMNVSAPTPKSTSSNATTQKIKSAAMKAATNVVSETGANNPLFTRTF